MERVVLHYSSASPIVYLNNRPYVRMKQVVVDEALRKYSHGVWCLVTNG